MREPGPDEPGPGLGTGKSDPLASISNEQDWSLDIVIRNDQSGESALVVPSSAVGLLTGIDRPRLIAIRDVQLLNALLGRSL